MTKLFVLVAAPFILVGLPVQAELTGTLRLSGERCTDYDPPPPPASVYAVTGHNNSPSTLYELDRNTAAILRVVGPTGFSYITAMDFHPATRKLYAFAQDAASCCPPEGDLITLDLDTGTGTIIAGTGAFADIGFHPDGRLFGIEPAMPGGNRVFQIDVDTGAILPVSDFSYGVRPGISFDALGDGTVLSEGGDLYALDPDIPSTSFSHLDLWQTRCWIHWSMIRTTSCSESQLGSSMMFRVRIW